MDIAAINRESDLLHACDHEFWEEEDKRNSLLEFLVSWSKNPTIYANKSQETQHETTEALISHRNDDNEPIEIKFIDGLFEL